MMDTEAGARAKQDHTDDKPKRNTQQAILIPTRPRTAIMAQCECCGSVIPSCLTHQPVQQDLQGSLCGSVPSSQADSTSGDDEKEGRRSRGSLKPSDNPSPSVHTHDAQDSKLVVRASSRTDSASLYSPTTPRTPPLQTPTSSASKLRHNKYLLN